MAFFLAPLLKTAGAFLAKKSVGTAIAKTVAGSLVSGAIASNQQKKNLAFQQAQSDQNEGRHSDRFVDLVENAQRAGFNPLTALRADGASTYQAPILNAPMSSSTFIGNALVDGMNTGFNYDQQKRDEERDNLERDIMKAQLDQLQKANKVRGGEYFGYGIPNAQTTSMADASARAPRLSGVSGSSKYLNTDGSPYVGPAPIHLYRPYADKNNMVFWGANPDIPDLDQLAVPVAIGGAGKVKEKLHQTKEAGNLFSDWLDKQASSAWKRINNPIPPRLTPSTNPRRPKTFNSRAY